MKRQEATVQREVTLNMENKELALNDLAQTKSSKGKKLLMLLALVVAGALCFTLLPKTSSGEEISQPVYKETKVQRGDITVGVTETGTATIATKELSVDFDTTVEEVYVKAGQSVKAGDVLARVSTEDLEKEISDQQTTYEKAKTELEQAIIDQKLKTLDAEYELKNNSSLSENAESIYNSTIEQLEYDTASYANQIDSIEDDMAYYRKLIKGYSDEADEVNELKAAAEEAQELLNTLKAAEEPDAEAIAAAQSAYTTAYNNYKKAKDDYEDKLDTAEDKLENLENDYNAAILKYQSAQSRLTAQTLDAELTYQQNLTTASNADTLYELQLAQLNNSVVSAQLAVDEAAKKLEELQATASTGTLVAPCDGLVMSVLTEEGDEINAKSTILTITNSKKAYVSVSVAQEDISSLSLGSPANVSLSAYEEKFTGTVDSISIVPARSNSSTVSYTVSVLLDGDTSAIYEGMTGDVTFVTKEITDVVYVSNKAVTVRDAKSYVKVMDEAGNTEEVEVTTGFSDGKNVEILSGLEEGQIALIESQVGA